MSVSALPAEAAELAPFYYDVCYVKYPCINRSIYVCMSVLVSASCMYVCTASMTKGRETLQNNLEYIFKFLVTCKDACEYGCL